MNNAWEIANELCRRVTELRLHRAGELVNVETHPLAAMSDTDRQPWLDTARVMEEMRVGRQHVDVLRSLCDDWDRYTATLQSDSRWCNEMRRALVVEMRHATDRLWEQCQDKEPTLSGT